MNARRVRVQLRLTGLALVAWLLLTAPALSWPLAILDSPRVLSVVTLRNGTTATVHYQLRWPGAEWKEFSVEPAKLRWHWIEGEDVRPEVRFDHSFEPGFQEKLATLTARDLRTEATKPKSNDGLVYAFKLKG